MRWFKHLCETRQDEKIARLIAHGGHAAYGLWWMVLETIARTMDKGSDKCSVVYPVSKWAVELQTTPCNVRKRLTALVAAGLLEMSCDKAGIELAVPNLLKYRDEWQSKLGSNSRARIQSQKQIQKQITDSAFSAPKTPEKADGKAAPEESEVEKWLRKRREFVYDGSDWAVKKCDEMLAKLREQPGANKGCSDGDRGSQSV